VAFFISRSVRCEELKGASAERLARMRHHGWCRKRTPRPGGPKQDVEGRRAIPITSTKTKVTATRWPFSFPDR